MLNEKAIENLRNSKITSSALLQMYELMVAQCENLGAEGTFHQFVFVSDPSDIAEGDWIPEIHLSIRKQPKRVTTESKEV